MLPDLRPVYGRLERAQELLQTLEREVDTYAGLPPYQVRKSHSEDGQRTTERAELTVNPPGHLSMVFSDLTHQLRSTLDNLVGCVRPGGPTEKSAFPINATAEGFQEAARARLDAVASWAREVIERVQPFSLEDHWRLHGDSLLILNELARRDRHRAPRLHAAFVLPDYAEVDVEGPLEWRADRLGRWASAEYGAVAPPRVHYRVEVVLHEPEVPAIDGWEVVSIGKRLERAVRYAVVEQVAWLATMHQS